MKSRRLNYHISCIVVILLFVSINSCDDEPAKPQCEIYNTGTVTVKNSTGYNVWVDVTWGNITENEEKLLYNGNSFKYTGVPAGTVEIWVSLDGDNWRYEYEQLSACEDMTYRWYEPDRKSTGSPFVTYINGVETTPTLKVKHPN